MDDSPLESAASPVGLEAVWRLDASDAERSRLKLLSAAAGAIVCLMAAADLMIVDDPAPTVVGSWVVFLARGVVLALTATVWWSAHAGWSMEARDRAVGSWLGAFLGLLLIVYLQRPSDAVGDLGLAPIAIFGVLTLVPTKFWIAVAVATLWTAETWAVATYVRVLSPFDYTALLVGVFVTLWMATALRWYAMKREAEAQQLKLRVAELRSFARMCAWCRRLQGPDQEWSDLETFLGKVDYSVTHGMCPSCAAEARRDIARGEER